MLMMVLPTMLMMALLSPAGDSVAVATWVRCDVDVESS
jgi:hypothetical protein